MPSLTRLIVASAAVALVMAVVVAGATLGPEEARRWLLLSGLVATVAAIQGVGSDPADLGPALVFSLPPVLALMAEGSPAWLIGPLGVALLLSAELSALSWEWQGEAALTPLRRRRLLRIAALASLGLAAAVAVPALALVPVPAGTPALAVAALALGALGAVLFRSGSRSRPDPGRISARRPP